MPEHNAAGRNHEADAAPPSSSALPEPLGPFRSVPVELTAVLVRTTVAVRDILNLEPGSLLPLPVEPRNRVEIHAPGARLARGEIRIREGRRCVRVTVIEGTGEDDEID